MRQINDNPFAPHKMRAVAATGRGNIPGFISPTAGVVDRTNPSSGYGPGGGRNIGTTPTPGNPYNTGFHWFGPYALLNGC